MKKSKRSISFFLALILIISNTTIVFAKSNDYSNHWAKEEIQYLMGKDIVSGYSDGNFKPDQSVTRAEFFKIINNVFGYSQKESIEFKDVGKGDWYYEDIRKALAAGYASGYSDGTMKPNRPITRQEASKIISIAYGLDDKKSKSADNFTDKKEIEDWGKEYIGILKDRGYISGYADGTFRPNAKITRAELSKIITNASGNIINTQGEYSNSVNGNVLINTPNVKLKDMHIKGDLYLAEGIKEGDISLDNVIVDGEIYIRGYGGNNVRVKDSKLRQVNMKKTSKNANLILQGKTEVKSILVNDNNKLVLETGVSVDTIEIKGKSNIEVGKEVKVKEIKANVKGIKIKSEGKIESILAKEDLMLNNKLIKKGESIKEDDKPAPAPPAGGGGGAMPMPVPSPSPSPSPTPDPEPEKPKISMTQLKDKIAEARNLSKDKYTEDTWEKLVSAIDKAESVANSGSATNEDIELAYNQLKNSINSLIKLKEIGDEMNGDLIIVNRDYKDNNIKADNIGNVRIKLRGKDVTEDFTFKFYDKKENGNEITDLDLSNGATTFKVYMEATSEKYENISGYVVFKYSSVTIGKNEKYYTIEDALNLAKSGDTIYVKYNTSFASDEVAKDVYKGNTFTVKSGVNLVLPYDKSLSSNTTDTDIGRSPLSIARDSAYVNLTMPKGINLNVKGNLIVNGKRSADTPAAGYIVGTNYAQINMLEDSNIVVEEGGTLNSIGFIYGEGKVEAESGGKIYDSFLITDFRGGTISSKIYNEVFPFDQYSFHNIEVPLTINFGGDYYARALIYADNTYVKSAVHIIGKSGDKSLIKLNSGKIEKSFDDSTGKVTLDFNGDIKINDLVMEGNLEDYGISGSLSTKDKEMPFPGNFRLNVKSGTLTLDAGIKLLPGAELNVEGNAKFTITENGRLMIYDAKEYTQSRGYPMKYKDYYRIEPEYAHNLDTPAVFVLNGELIVNGGIAGKINTESTGTIEISSSASTELKINHVESDGEVVENTYNLKDENGNEINGPGKYKIDENGSWISIDEGQDQ